MVLVRKWFDRMPNISKASITKLRQPVLVSPECRSRIGCEKSGPRSLCAGWPVIGSRTAMRSSANRWIPLATSDVNSLFDRKCSISAAIFRFNTN